MMLSYPFHSVSMSNVRWWRKPWKTCPARIRAMQLQKKEVTQMSELWGIWVFCALMWVEFIYPQHYLIRFGSIWYIRMVQYYYAYYLLGKSPFESEIWGPAPPQWSHEPRVFETTESEWLNMLPIPSMYGIFTYIWWYFMVNLGKYAIHGWYDLNDIALLISRRLTDFTAFHPSVFTMLCQMFLASCGLQVLDFPLQKPEDTKLLSLPSPIPLEQAHCGYWLMQMTGVEGALIISPGTVIPPIVQLVFFLSLHFLPYIHNEKHESIKYPASPSHFSESKKVLSHIWKNSWSVIQ